MSNFLIALVLAASSSTAPVPVAPGIHLLPGGFAEGGQPDGNTVVLRGAQGLVVVDTGRHRAHTQGILDFAHAERRPIAVVVNTHWHLDHVSGNPAVKAAFPGLRVVGSGAIRDALKGFLADYRRQLAELVARPGPAAVKARHQEEIARIDSGPRLLPDEVVTTSGRRTLAGRDLQVNLETHAVTAGDVWVFDPATRVLMAGDLVTLPAPFLDTACPARWKDALGRVAATDFVRLVPGHGPVLTRMGLDRYRLAFGNLLACAASPRTTAECVTGWLGDAAELVPEGEERNRARSLVEYYVDAVLRGDPAKLAARCGGPPSATPAPAPPR